jgi:hypothetical protein
VRPPLIRVEHRPQFIGPDELRKVRASGDDIEGH